MTRNRPPQAERGPRAPRSVAQVMASVAAQSNNELVRAKYEKIEKIGEGTFAAVFLARNVETEAKVAIKKIKMGAIGTRDGIDITAMREFKFLKELRHPNIIAVRARCR